MNPSSRFLATGLVTVVVLAAAAMAGIVWQTAQMAKAGQTHKLQSVSRLVSELQKDRISELKLRTHFLASDPAFVDYVSQALIPDPHLGGAIDGASISNLLDERREGYDSAVVLDSRGKLAARSGRVLLRSDGYSHDKLVVQSLASRTPAVGIWSGGGQLAWVAVEPLMRGGVLQGMLVTSRRIDDDFIDSVATMSETEVAILVPSAKGTSIVASSNIGTLVGDELARNDDDPLAVTKREGRPLFIRYPGGSSLSWVTPLDTAVGKAALVVLPHVQGSPSAIEAKVAPWLLAVVVLALIAALLIVQQWRRTYVPLQQMHDVIDRAANGERLITLRTTGSASVRSLTEVINRLLRHYQK